MDPKKSDSILNTTLYGIPFNIESFKNMPYPPLVNQDCMYPMSAQALGKFGYPETGDGSRIDEKQAFDILDKAVELGVTFWDTANRYNNASGNSERVIGK